MEEKLRSTTPLHLSLSVLRRFMYDIMFFLYNLHTEYSQRPSHFHPFFQDIKINVGMQSHLKNMKINILGISELKWTGMDEFNSDDHYINYCGQESLKRNGVAIIVKKKSPKCSTWMQAQKRQNNFCLFPKQTIQYHGNPSLCPY